MSDIAGLVTKMERMQEDKRVAIVTAILISNDPAIADGKDFVIADGKDPAELVNELMNDYLSFRSVADRAKYAARKLAPGYTPLPQPAYAVA